MTDSVLHRLVAALAVDDAGDDPTGVSALDLASAIWLARHLTPHPRATGTGSVRSPEPPKPPSAGGPGGDSSGVSGAGGDLHLPAPDSLAVGRGHLVRGPVVPALPDSLAIGRALRPLKRRVPAPGGGLLDEARTASATAESDVFLPIMRPPTERWLRLDLVIDRAASMRIWSRTVAELSTLLENHGAFRVVCRWQVDGDATEAVLAPYRPVSGEPDRAGRSPRELFDAGGRRVVLVVTDGVGAGWRSGAIPALLAKWRGTHLVTIVNVLPRRMWHRTGITPVPVSARAERVGSGAATVHMRPRLLQPGGDDLSALMVPLDRDGLGLWAGLVAGTAPSWVPATAAAGRPRASAGHPLASPPLRAEERVDTFRATAGAAAFDLACWLAPMALNLPVMRLVQHAMMPTSTSSDLAEVLFSGLLYSTGPAVPHESADDVGYDFLPGVREVLLDHLTRTETLAVARALESVSGQVTARLGSTGGFRAVVATGAEGVGAQVPATMLPFGRLAPAALRRLGVADTVPPPAEVPAAEREPVISSRPPISPARTSPTPRPTAPVALDIDPQAPIFFISRAIDRRGGDSDAREFFNDLSNHVRELIGRVPGDDPGFIDLGLAGGTRWTPELLRAAGTCQVFIPLLSPRLFESEWCGREWSAFARRTVLRRETGQPEPHNTAIIPVLWTRTDISTAPAVVRSIQQFVPWRLPDPATVARYQADGVYGLRRLGLRDDYQAITWRLAQRVVEVYRTQYVEPFISGDFELRNAFAEEWS